MTELNSKPDRGVALVVAKGLSSSSMQRYLDDITTLLNLNLLGAQVSLTSYLVANLPDVQPNVPGMIFVSDEAGGAVMAFSEGANWRRCTDRAIVS